MILEVLLMLKGTSIRDLKFGEVVEGVNLRNVFAILIVRLHDMI
jgi:hypothetical protein